MVYVERQVLTLTGKTVFKYFAEDIFLVQCPGSKRDRETLEIIILAHVAPGTTIYTDVWAAYRKLGSKGYIWDMVNHSGKLLQILL